MTKLTTPISEATIRSLKVGDEAQINDMLFTGRVGASSCWPRSAGLRSGGY